MEDMSSLFESIAKNCDFAASQAIDPQFKSYLQSLGNDHRSWISSTSSIITGKSRLQ
jgi:hypothetical protein